VVEDAERGNMSDMRAKEMFTLPIAALTPDEKMGCLYMYALYFHRDGLSTDRAMEVMNDWVSEYGSKELAIEALRKKVNPEKIRRPQ
jgi:hypothetical protein